MGLVIDDVVTDTVVLVGVGIGGNENGVLSLMVVLGRPVRIVRELALDLDLDEVMVKVSVIGGRDVNFALLCDDIDDVGVVYVVLVGG